MAKTLKATARKAVLRTEDTGVSTDTTLAPEVRLTRTRRQYKSDAFEAIHSVATDLHAAGLLSKRTMREFDADCLAPPPLSPAAIKRLRRKLGVSQPVLAAYLNTTPSTVVQWESGAKKPSGMGLRLLQIAEKKGLAGLE